MKITFHSKARTEFFEATEYYEDQVVGLGDDFIDEVEKVMDVIFKNPIFQEEIDKSKTLIYAS